MQCPSCKDDNTRVKNSRGSEQAADSLVRAGRELLGEKNFRIRARECKTCGKNFRTIEVSYSVMYRILNSRQGKGDA